ncbi:ubiquitin-activating enzyme [Hamiltosporidium tvaerminnensis]|uniref:Ubiquitin-activating enzyme n=1 Tax=Hamiltosporidium tvaerminnensis TaxID=1176355 RepID=A0A4Q9LSH8_9MICR|nr:ubiquitin-activating enzyme [Hamiltosporidium tvaerminnensis]
MSYDRSHAETSTEEKTVSIFSDTFLIETSLLVNALDNIEARLYVDRRCITNKIPLFESGTLGTKESYSSSRDQPDKSIPSCSIQWALSEFKSNFEEKIISICEYIKCGGDILEGDSMDRGINYRGVNYRDSKLEGNSNGNIELDPVNNSINNLHPVNTIPTTSTPYITNATTNNTIPTHDNLSTESVAIETFPVGHVTREGQPFWVPLKRPPLPFIFNKDDCVHVLFVQSYCRVICNVYEIKGLEGNGDGVSYKEVKDIIRDGIYDKSMLEGVNDNGSKLEGVSEKGSNIKGVSNSTNKQHPFDNCSIKQHPLNKSSNEQRPFNHQPNTLHTNIPSYNNTNNIITLHPVTLKKDNDSNGHIDFIYACANLKAHNYKIKEVSKLTVKGIAGRIIPAIATTTSVISGLCVLEMIGYFLYGLSFIRCKSVIEAEKMECGMVRCDSREGGVNNRDRLEGVSDSNGLEGVSNSNGLEGVNTSTSKQHPVNTYSDILHPVNTNSTTFTLWNTFVPGDCKLSEILKYFNREWNVDISMKEGEGVIICVFECLFDIDNFPEVVVDFRREKERFRIGVRVISDW